MNLALRLDHSLSLISFGALSRRPDSYINISNPDSHKNISDDDFETLYKIRGNPNSTQTHSQFLSFVFL
jgi:hypothetical protein